MKTRHVVLARCSRDPGGKLGSFPGSFPEHFSNPCSSSPAPTQILMVTMVFGGCDYRS